MRLSRRIYGLIALAVLAFLLRAALVAWLAFAGDMPYTYEHGVIAENLLAGKGFSIRFLGVEGPTSQQGPIYPTALAVLYAVFGTGSRAALVTMQLLQCVAGGVLVVALARFVWAIAPRRPAAGWLAALGATFFPTHIYLVTHIQVVAWVTTLLVLMLATVAATNVRRTWLRAACAGGLAALLILSEPIMALAVVVAAMLLFKVEYANAAGEKLRKASTALAMMTATAMLVVAPWIVRNRAVHGEWVFVKSTFGYAFWQGNNPHSWGTDKLPTVSRAEFQQGSKGDLASQHQALREARLETKYIDDVVLAPEGYEQFAGLTEPQRSQLLADRAYQFIAKQPRRYAALCAQRLRYFMLFDETNPKTFSATYRAATVTWLVLALVGLLATLGQWRVLWPTYLIFAAVTLFHTMTITSVRFRIAIEPLSLIWIALALEPLLAHFKTPIAWARNLMSAGEESPAATELQLAGPHYLRQNPTTDRRLLDETPSASQRHPDVSQRL